MAADARRMLLEDGFGLEDDFGRMRVEVSTGLTAHVVRAGTRRRHPEPESAHTVGRETAHSAGGMRAE